MKAMVKRKMDGLGRIHIPTKVREELRLEAGVMLTIEQVGSEIVIYREGDFCKICGDEATEKVKNEFVCDNCIAEIKKSI